MATHVKPIPEGYHTVTPQMVVRKAAEAIDFYRRAFGAEELHRHLGPDGKSIIHAALQIGDARVMLSDEFPDWGVKSPQSLGGTPVSLHLYVPDADTAFQRAIKAGATVTMPLSDQFWGDRYGKLQDPYGHQWSISTHIEDVSPAEMQKRAAAAFSGGACGEKKK